MPGASLTRRPRRRRSAELYQLLREATGAASKPLAPRLAGLNPRAVNPGGGEIQMLATERALRALGVDASIGSPAEFVSGQCLHLFGSLPEHLPFVRKARGASIPVLVSPIAWFDVLARWHEPLALGPKALGCAGLVARRAFPRLPDWRGRLYRQVDLLLPNSQAEADQLRRLFAVRAEKIRVVPNGADPRFAEATPDLFHETYGLRDFVLYAGRVEPRKNQLGFLKALRDFDLPIVVLGDPLVRAREYYLACRDIAGPNVHFLPRFQHDSPLLASAYAACRCLALTSWFETPGLVALEAAMSGTPLALTSRGSAREYFGERARYAHPASPAEIRSAVEAACQQPRNLELKRHVRANYTWGAVARATWEAYQSVA